MGCCPRLVVLGSIERGRGQKSRLPPTTISSLVAPKSLPLLTSIHPVTRLFRPLSSTYLLPHPILTSLNSRSFANSHNASQSRRKEAIDWGQGPSWQSSRGEEGGRKEDPGTFRRQEEESQDKEGDLFVLHLQRYDESHCTTLQNVYFNEFPSRIPHRSILTRKF